MMTTTKTFTIKVSGSSNLTIEAETCDKVRDLKALITEKTKMPGTQQKLVFKGKVLVDDDMLEEKKILSGATIFLVKGVVDKSSSSSAEPETKIEEKKEAALQVKCEGGCGFWGSASLENYCSKCFKVKQEKDQEQLKKAQEEAIAKEKSEKEGNQANKEDEETEMKARPVQEHKNRCWTCAKKVALTGIECRCGYTFCTTHRLPEEHECDFDYKTCGRALLRKQNNKVAADKLGDRV